MFVGREKEIGILDQAYRAADGRLVVIYGRRRIGKSRLVEEFGAGKKNFYRFEALEGLDTGGQIQHFTSQLFAQSKEPLAASLQFRNWNDVFRYLTDRLTETTDGAKPIFFFDELQWMAAGQGRLISIIKYFWDNFWKKKKVMLILCGSVASFMVRRVLSSKALYGRVSAEILLRGLSPDEALRFFKGKRSDEELLKYQLVFGTVPKYLEEIDCSRSFEQNMNRLCFSPNGLMLNEPDRIFYSQFREGRTYQQIVTLLQNGPRTAGEISLRLGIPSGGGLKLYLDNLEHADIIRSVVPFDRDARSKFRAYTLVDEFLSFYFKYIEPNLATIRESTSRKLFETITKDGLDIWLGFAFERFCLKYSGILARVMGFEDTVLRAAPYFGRNDERFQIDLVYRRSDKVITVCEIKYQDREIGPQVIPAVERKCKLLKIPKGHTLERALISIYGPDKSLRGSDYFHHVVTLKDIVGKK